MKVDLDKEEVNRLLEALNEQIDEYSFRKDFNPKHLKLSDNTHFELLEKLRDCLKKFGVEK